MLINYCWNVNKFMYDDIMHLPRKPFCRYYLRFFSTKEILKRFIKNFFRISRKKC